MTTPIILYVDDEPMNLTVLEAALPENWKIHTFDSPVKALDEITKISPWIVISDQKMPGMNGVTFLENVKKLCPDALRVIVTGFSDEDLVVDSVRKAQISDYIKKPWDVDDLSHRVSKLVDSYLLEREIKNKTLELEVKNSELSQAMLELEKSKKHEEDLKIELQSWAPPFILEQIEQNIEYPIKKDLVLINYDLIDSSEMHDVVVGGKLAKSLVMHKFTEIILKHNGWREHHAGDLAYAHFGLLKSLDLPCDIALLAATEFVNFLNDFNMANNTHIECGIGLHFAKNCTVDLHKVEVFSQGVRIIQKSFDTTSKEVDLVFRIEKVAHDLSGTNIVMTEEFKNRLSNQNIVFHEIKNFKPKGFDSSMNIYIHKNQKCSEAEINSIQLKMVA